MGGHIAPLTEPFLAARERGYESHWESTNFQDVPRVAPVGERQELEHRPSASGAVITADEMRGRMEDTL
jgi:hypothetical protein